MELVFLNLLSNTEMKQGFKLQRLSNLNKENRTQIYVFSQVKEILHQEENKSGQETVKFLWLLQK